jgi:Cu/Zn superoxide dismutase
MRRTLISLVALVALLAVPAIALSAKTQKFHASLNGKQEVPKGNTKATGTAKFTLSSDGKKLAFVLKASGLTGQPVAAHIHLGKPGTAGPVIIALELKPFKLPAHGTVTAKQFVPSGNVKTFAAAIKAMGAGRTYVNIHTKKFPGGEVRGQVKKG